MPPAARHAAGSKNRPIQLVGFGDVVIAAGVDEVLTTSTPGKPILGGSSEKSARRRRQRRGTKVCRAKPAPYRSSGGDG